MAEFHPGRNLALLDYNEVADRVDPGRKETAKLNITILTVGSRGDVQPYMALGLGLQGAGHRVRLATHAIYEAFVRRVGLEFYPVAGDPRGTLEGEAGLKWLETSRNPFTFMSRMMDAARPVMWQIADDYYHACQEADWILFPVLAALLAASISEKLKIPATSAYLQHVHPTRLYPSGMLPPRPVLGGGYNQLSYKLGGELFWRFMRPMVNAWRRESLGLPPYPSRSPLDEWGRQKATCLYGISPHVLPRAPEWGDHIAITGYWFLEAAQAEPEWHPPQALVDFLAAGPAPVFIGFGSMTGRNPEELTALSVQALAQARQRGLLLAGWGGLGATKLPDDMMMIDSAPFDWLFPHMAAIVHHGGAGTTAASLRAGVPTIVTPFFGDQNFWAWRVEALGVGPPAIPRKRLSAGRLAAAIQQATTDREMQRRARALGEQIRLEHGVEAAVAALQPVFEIHQV